MSKKIKVLVVDDDRGMVKTICDILRFKGFDTEQACSGEEAVAKVKEGGLACVLMDTFTVKLPLGEEDMEEVKFPVGSG